MSKAFVLGGTGLLGYHTIQELLKRGYGVSTIALPPLPADGLLPEEVDITLGNIFEMSDDEVLALLEGHEFFLYAAGVDERVLPEAPAAHFFYTQNVLPTQRLARLARLAGVKKFVIYGSYFAHFAEQWEDLELKKEGYPRTRLLQEEVAMLEGEGAMDVMSLRLPYIFGTMPGRKPLWEMFLPQVQGKDFVPVLNGGTAMVTVRQVAQAAVGALENGTHGSKYPICDTNMKLKEFYEIIAETLGQTNTTVQVMPLEQLLPHFEARDVHAAEEGKEHGIHVAKTAYVQDRDAYVDPALTMPVLGIEKDDVRAAIVESIQACL